MKYPEPMSDDKHRNADAPLPHYSKDGFRSLLFVKPWEEDQDFVTFLDYVTRKKNNVSQQSTIKASESQEEVRYAQTRLYTHCHLHSPRLTNV
jgi:hypothetical protein